MTPIYLYETIPADGTRAPRHFEAKQSMRVQPLIHDPENGLAVKRLIQGGYLHTHSMGQGRRVFHKRNQRMRKKLNPMLL